MIDDIGYALYSEQSVAADGKNYESYYKTVHRNELLKYRIFLPFSGYQFK